MGTRKCRWATPVFIVLVLGVAGCRPQTSEQRNKSGGNEKYLPIEGEAASMLYAPAIYIPEEDERRKK